MWELTKSFRFEAAHALSAATLGARVEALGPPTLENLSRFIFERLQHAGKLACVSVHRDSCNENCTYFGPEA
jgi:6-pyruvoyl-tetrahydropterin synthase